MLAARAWIERGGLALLCAVTLMACGLWVSFDDYDTSSVRLFAVGGVVVGLPTDGRVTLKLNTSEAALQVGNERFAFGDKLTDGQRYEVKAIPPDGYECPITDGVGTISGADVTSVAVHCVPSDVLLTSLSVSDGELGQPFDALVDAYDVRFPRVFPRPATVRVTAVAHAAIARIQVNGVEITSGVASPPIPVPSELGKLRFDVGVTASDRAGTPITKHYTLAAVPSPIDYLKASNTRIASYFGYSVALSGDTLVVGSKEESSGASGVGADQQSTSAVSAGAAYVFTRNRGVWSQEAYLKASDAQMFARFGASVALSGDTLIVGAPGSADAKAPASEGAAYVFTRKQGVWSETARLRAWNAAPAASFGQAVAISADSFVVGSYTESSDAAGVDQTPTPTPRLSSGAAYVFLRTATGASPQAYLKASNPQAGARFGISVALSGDTVAVGSADESSAAEGIHVVAPTDTAAPSSGAVYVFTRTSGVWSQQAYVKASNTRTNASFGWSVALSGETLAVGSYHESSNATGIGGTQDAFPDGDSGATYVFTRKAGTWTQQAYVKASNTRNSAHFGSALALSGDMLAVGSQGESSSAAGVDGNQANDPATPAAGAAYLFVRTGSAWAQHAYVKATNPRENAHFGDSLALDGKTLAVGSPGESSEAKGVNGIQASAAKPNAGAVYVYR